jgi:hypothetical protein
MICKKLIIEGDARLALYFNNKKLPKKTSDFIVPGYYKDFKCKGTDCRNTCCSGWKVTIPMNEYFLLHGIECNKDLKDKIDRAFRPIYMPTPERYAEMVNNYYGNCPLLMDNGYCNLHSKCGEEYLPTVCKTYPRSIKTDYAFEASCANSCEKTIELLMDNSNKLNFEILSIDYFESLNNLSDTDKSFYSNLRKVVFDIMSNRDYPIQRRILRIGELFTNLDIDNNNDIYALDWNILNLKDTDVDFTIDTMKKITNWYKENNRGLADYLLEVEEYYSNGNLKENYLKALNHFNEILPNSEIVFEKILLNHLFFRQFPFQPYFKTFFDEFIGLSGLYLIIRYVSIPLMVNKNRVQDFIDLQAKLFRVISHSKFEYNIMVLLKNEIPLTFDTITNLITI